MRPRKRRDIAEFGDFQTPDELAREVVALFRARVPKPATIIEPSCGKGAFLAAAHEAFPDARLFGLDINASYLDVARLRLPSRCKLTLVHDSFFHFDWMRWVQDAAGPLLVLGNPPWVTNSELGGLRSDNLPAKTNVESLKGFEAVTGKANFDISEWMLMKSLEWLGVKGGALAVLCKAAVARKILSSVWKRSLPISAAALFRIDAAVHFSAAVEACLFLVEVNGTASSQSCSIYPSLQAQAPCGRFGWAEDALVSDMEAYERHKHVRGTNKTYVWRSGLKHDCAKVMELERSTGFWNGYGEKVDVEDTYLYPLVKSADIAGVRRRDREKWVIVTQCAIGEDTGPIARLAPKTWAYLNRHRAAFERRTSIIYRNKPDFSMFGVGAYSFAPWKVAISGLYKKLAFRLYGPVEGKPVMFDDTVYVLPFDNRAQAQAVLDLLDSDIAHNFLESMVFWDEKRPITVELLKRLDIARLAQRLGRSDP
ncbi:SAM-dependent DNA methyltransferase [Rhodoblastus acidophilus]|uniref:site-specific DNA-methyltransferase (adenine-specific) n=1 Tax=Rhodoblastus acidophilus TaxID=1074 RepID=A0A6N8DQU5_RHOAC|nr:class I SAM-dependent methyltransferase [Rhodoblastus acidophilus]MCW2275985.1 hypothetical protein [Rhodoblastus acidophilus]MTV32658.1 SAM-dependent DNA methyltransferase [Rhodoblastus acidophilus]